MNGAIAAATRRSSSEKLVLDAYDDIQARLARQRKSQTAKEVEKQQAERLKSTSHQVQKKESVKQIETHESVKQIRTLMRRHGVDAAGCLRKPEQVCSLLAEVFNDAPLDGKNLQTVLSSAGVQGSERIQVTMHDLEALFDAYEKFNEERARLDVLFAEIDANGSGLIERHEVARYMAILGASAGVPNVAVSDADVQLQLVLDACGCSALDGVRRAELPELLEAAKGWAEGLRPKAADAKSKGKLRSSLRACAIL